MKVDVFVVLFVCLTMLAYPINSSIRIAPVVAYSGIFLSAWASHQPTVDGTIDPTVEWGMADTQEFSISGSCNGTLFVMNDAANLYLAVKIVDDDFGMNVSTRDFVMFHFDNDHDSVGPEVGDDCLVCISNGINFDQFYESPGSDWDSLNLGTDDGAAAASGDGTYNYFEISHPLDSGDDAHDFSLAVGDTVGFMIQYADNNTFVGGWPTGVNPFQPPTSWHEIKIASQLYQGDLILSDNDVYTITGSFFINGSILVKDNATLILKDAFVNFTQTHEEQFVVMLHEAYNGNPRLQVDKSTITSDHNLNMMFLDNSTGSISELNIEMPFNFFPIYAWQNSSLTISDSTGISLTASDYSSVTISNCSLYGVQSWGPSSMSMEDSNVTHYSIRSSSVNCSIVGLKSGFFDAWNYQLNCSVSVGLGGWTPTIILVNSQVSRWYFSFSWRTNATILNCTLLGLDSIQNSTVIVTDSVITQGIFASNNAKIWLINCTGYQFFNVIGQAHVYIYWYADVHVVDYIFQNVPSANVTATHANDTKAETTTTGTDGWARLTLMEEMKNATGTYPAGNYTIEATYGNHSRSTTVNMTLNKEITLSLDFEIPEFPSTIIIPLSMIATLLPIVAYRKKCGRRNRTRA